MPQWFEICDYCQREFDFLRAAIVLDDDAPPQYEPFREDWRGGYVKIAHPKCFAEAEGLDALLAAAERNDRRIRGDFRVKAQGLIPYSSPLDLGATRRFTQQRAA